MSTPTIPVPEGVDEIIRVLVGSTLYGTGLPGHEDTDYMGVCIEPWEAILGLERFEQWVWRTQPEGVRSGPGDIDITIYGLRKFLKLAAQGNPSIQILLFVPSEYTEVQTQLGKELQALAPAIVSKQALPRYLGYAQAQRGRLEGSRGGKHTNRPELIEMFGYDTKYAMHAMRLTLQGQELMRTGRIELPIGEHGDYLRSIRNGEVEFDEVVSRLLVEEDRLVKAGEESSLPEKPDYDKIHDFMFAARMERYHSQVHPPYRKGLLQQ